MTFGEEALRVRTPGELSLLNDWIHDAYVEDAIEFSADESRAVIPFAQESGWGTLHPSMADPELVRTTIFARHYEVPLTRCYLVVDHAESFEAEIDWGCPMLLEARYENSAVVLTTVALSPISIPVRAIDIRVFVSAGETRRLRRKVLRGWPIQSDGW